MSLEQRIYIMLGERDVRIAQLSLQLEEAQRRIKDLEAAAVKIAEAVPSKE